MVTETLRSIHEGIAIKTSSKYPAKSLLEWSNRSNISQNNKKQNLFLTSIKLHPTSPNKCYVTKQGGQTGPTFHQTLVFEMLGEMFDQFDQSELKTF